MLEKVNFKIMKLDHTKLPNLVEDAKLLPTKGTPGSAGYDLRAAIDHPVKIFPGESLLLSCGFAVEIPEGHVGLVCPRSGLALKHHITILNSPGVIDSDYRGMMHVLLYKLPYVIGAEAYSIQPNEKIGQLIIIKTENMYVPTPVNELSDSERGSGGFGSTGKV